MTAAPLSPVALRLATSADQATVVTLLGELVDELGPREMAERVKGRLDDDITSALASQRVRIFLAEAAGQPLGLSRADVLYEDPIFRLREDHRCGYVDQMFVRAAHRNRGVGALLLRACEDWFRAQGIAHVLLHAAPNASRFYARYGYQSNRELFKRL